MSSSPNEVPVGVRVSVNGADDAYSKLKKLHDELNRGEISYQDYRKGARESNALLNSNTKLWSESKAAIYATNPTLLEFSRTMSGFGQITSAASTGMTAINTALLLMQGNSDGINQTKIKMAEMQNQLDQLVASGQGGTVMAQNLRNGIAQLGTVLGNQMQQQWVNQIVATISFAGALGQVAVGATTAGTTIMALLKFVGGSGGAQMLENMSVAVTGLGNAFISAAIPAAAFLAVLYGGRALLDSLVPSFAKWDSDVQNAIIQNWHTDALEAYLLAPFVGAYIGMEEVGQQIHEFWLGIVTGIIQSFQQMYNGIASGVNALSMGTLHLPMQQLWTPPTSMKVHEQTSQQLLQQLLSGSGNLLPQASGQVQGALTSQLDTQQQIRDAQLQAGAILTSSDDNLVTINTSIGTTNSSINSLQTAMTAGLQAQKDATNAALDQLKQEIQQGNQQMQALQIQAAQLAAQPQSQTLYANDPGYAAAQRAYDTQYQTGGLEGDAAYTVPTSAANTLKSVNQQIAQLQATQANLTQQAQQIVANAATSGILDVSTAGAQATIASLGLNSTTGIGSIIAGALGNGQGSGGYAGINAAQLQQFVSTGDYGVFSQAVLGDNAALAAQTSAPNEAQALYNSYRAMGLSATDAAAQVNAVNRNSGGQVGTATVTNTTGGVTFAASGFEGMVNSPTMFMVGERGPEYMSIVPSGKRGSGGIIINSPISINGNIFADQALDSFVKNSIKSALKQAGFR